MSVPGVPRSTHRSAAESTDWPADNSAAESTDWPADNSAGSSPPGDDNSADSPARAHDPGDDSSAQNPARDHDPGGDSSAQSPARDNDPGDDSSPDSPARDNDPRGDNSDGGLAELDALLSAPLEVADCQRICRLAHSFPGRLRQVITSLAQVRQSAGVDALCSLPASAAGVLEGLCHAFRLGCTREIDGHNAPELLALEFRHSRARAFPALVAHAEAAFPEQLERLTLGRERWFRLVLQATPTRRALRLLLREHGDDLVYLHRHLGRLRRTRLWINGWCFESDPWTCARQVYLVQAWIEHASRTPAS